MIIPHSRKHSNELEDRTLGFDQNIYLSNATQQNIYVMPCPRLGWLITDVITDIALAALAFVQIPLVLLAGGIPRTIKTFADLFKLLRTAVTLTSGTTSAITRPGKAASGVIGWFQDGSIAIPPKRTENVLRANFFDTYLQASGLAGLFNAPTVSLIMMSGDGKFVTTWTSGPDMSWVARDDKIYRVKYGTLWDPDHKHKGIKFEGVEQQRRNEDSDDVTIINGVEIPWVVKWDTE